MLKPSGRPNVSVVTVLILVQVSASLTVLLQLQELLPIIAGVPASLACVKSATDADMLCRHLQLSEHLLGAG